MSVAVTESLLSIWLLTSDPARSKHTSKETSPRLSGSAVLPVSTCAWQALKIQQSPPRTSVAWRASCQPSLLRSKTHFPATCVWVWSGGSLLLHHIYIFTQKSQPYCLRKALIRREVIIILLLFSAQFLRNIGRYIKWHKSNTPQSDITCRCMLGRGKNATLKWCRPSVRLSHYFTQTVDEWIGHIGIILGYTGSTELREVVILWGWVNLLGWDLKG